MDTIRVNKQDTRPLSILSSDPDQQLSCGETAQLSVTGTYSSYLWSDGSNAATLTVSEPGDYALSVNTANGCTRTGQIRIEGEAPPAVSIQSSQSSICPGDPLVTLLAQVSPTDDYTFRWSNGQSGPQINVDQASTYTVTVSTAAGCTATATFELLDCEGTQRCNVEAPVDSFFCGALDSTVLSSQSTISTLQSGDRFMAGDFLVEVTSARSTGTFNGTGIIEVPYLQGARLNVSIVNARINTDCQLIDGFVEVEGTGLKLLSDEMISALDDVLDGLETIDDVLEGAEDIIDAIDKAVAFAEPYLPDGVLDSLLQAQEDLIKAKQAYEAAQASGDQAAIDAAEDALEAAKDALKDANQAYVKATTEFFKDFLEVVVAMVKDLLKDCVLTDRKQLYEEAYTTFDGEIENLNSSISLPTGANEPDGTSVSAMYSEYGVYE
ncbi:hypothetical protein, partial [Marinobacter sp.]|uniref:hypothetical protein n=1 Tax=Marinobacter sp. TaxID=50741 RepID=UPI002B47CD4C